MSLNKQKNIVHVGYHSDRTTYQAKSTYTDRGTTQHPITKKLFIIIIIKEMDNLSFKPSTSLQGGKAHTTMLLIWHIYYYYF